jgi:mannose-6-phosphate isomerase-like protein (cupin superfamily)
MKITLAETMAALPTAGQRYTDAARHGTMRLGMYAPRNSDDQKPHAQDELYVVVSGHGEFVCGKTRTNFESGDVLFAPAGIAHRFENFSTDFATWVVFYGPEGGEEDSRSPSANAPGAKMPKSGGKSAARDADVRSIRLIRSSEAA